MWQERIKIKENKKGVNKNKQKAWYSNRSSFEKVTTLFANSQFGEKTILTGKKENQIRIFQPTLLQNPLSRQAEVWVTSK